MLDLSDLTFGCLEDYTRTSEIDYDKESHSSPDKAFRGVLTTIHPEAEQALEKSHQNEDDYDLTIVGDLINVLFTSF